MPLPQSPNVTFDLYAGFSPANPYHVGTTPTLQDVLGILLPEMEAGKHGYQARNVYYTQLLLVDPALMPQADAYQGQLFIGVENPAGAATVIINDYPTVGRCTAFYVVLIQRRNRGLATDHFAFYLDRCLPRDQAPAGQSVPGFPCIIKPGNCPCPSMAARWQVTFANISNGACVFCSGWNTTWTLQQGPTPSGPCDQYNAGTSPCQAGAKGLILEYLSTSDTFRLVVQDTAFSLSTYYELPASAWNCNGPNTMTLIQRSTACNGWPTTVTLTPAS